MENSFIFKFYVKDDIVKVISDIWNGDWRQSESMA